jgi:NitT/TauT family transport system ATP-binding protein
VLRVEGLTLAYDGEPVLEDATLAVERGQFISLVGPSGSGKSTVLRAVMHLQKPSAGRIELDVADGEVGMLFQDDALLPWRTARDNVALGLRIRGSSREQARVQADEWLARMRLAGFEDRYPRELSGGQRKRVAIAQVLALRPKLLLMDEPFASLDAIVRHRITEELLGWVEREHLTVLLVTHDLEEAQVLSDAVYLLSRGPRARIRRRYDIPIPRPRDLVRARSHPSFGPLLERLWHDLSHEVEGASGELEEPALRKAS